MSKIDTYVKISEFEYIVRGQSDQLKPILVDRFSPFIHRVSHIIVFRPLNTEWRYRFVRKTDSIAEVSRKTPMIAFIIEV